MSLRLAVLALLDVQPASGYGLLQRFQTSIGCFWQTTHQQLYKELHALYAEGLLDCQTILQHDKPDKKIYTLNTAGQHMLDTLLQKPAQLPKIKDGFLVKLFAGHRIAKADLMAELQGLEQRHQECLQGYQVILNQYANLSPEQQQRYTYPIQTLKWGIHLEQSWLYWAQQCLQDLARMPDPRTASSDPIE
ncbi:MAG: PadR family transcriptional regulator [Moraxellaceae bacterium]